MLSLREIPVKPVKQTLLTTTNKGQIMSRTITTATITDCTDTVTHAGQDQAPLWLEYHETGTVFEHTGEDILWYVFADEYPEATQTYAKLRERLRSCAEWKTMSKDDIEAKVLEYIMNGRHADFVRDDSGRIALFTYDDDIKDWFSLCKSLEKSEKYKATRPTYSLHMVSFREDATFQEVTDELEACADDIKKRSLSLAVHTWTHDLMFERQYMEREEEAARATHK